MSSLKSFTVSLWHWPCLYTVKDDCLDYGIVKSEFDLQSQSLITPDIVQFLEGWAWWCFWDIRLWLTCHNFQFCSEHCPGIAKLFHKFEWVVAQLCLHSIICFTKLPIAIDFVLLARDSIYAIARYMPSPVRPSVCPSVRHTGESVKDVWS